MQHWQERVAEGLPVGRLAVSPGSVASRLQLMRLFHDDVVVSWQMGCMP